MTSQLLKADLLVFASLAFFKLVNGWSKNPGKIVQVQFYSIRLDATHNNVNYVEQCYNHCFGFFVII
jgi:hypothetical protein